jgi:hypothetical protein
MKVLRSADRTSDSDRAILGMIDEEIVVDHSKSLPYWEPA